MTNNVTEYWEVQKDGVWYSLHNYAYHVRTIYGGRLDPPSLRGENQYVAGVHGSWHNNNKVPDQRTLGLGGFLTNRDEDNVAIDEINKKVGFNQNWRTLQQLLWREDGSTFGIRRRWYDETGALIVGTGTAEFGGNMSLSDHVPAAGAWSCDLIMNDPYFYSTPVVTNVPITTPTVITNIGDVIAHPQVIFNGTLTNPQIDHDDLWVRLGTAIGIGDSITVETSPRVQTVVRTSDDANLIGALTRNGSRAWCPLRPGTNTMVLSVSGGTGNVQITHTPAYL